MGAVNIFLGGTGKFIAEDIQDARDFYQDPSIGDPVAFDLNATIRPGVQLRGFVSADQQTIAGVARLASEWAALDPGRALGPAEGSGDPGPRIAPEQAPLARIGAGIAANPAPTAGLFALRAHGLAVFSMLFDDRHARAGAGPGNELRQQIAARVRAETRDGAAPRINIVTSTAGGTGAGMVIPLALWLREEYPNSPLNLVAVTASAFASVLHGAPGLEEIRAKGLSGTYALLRELSFFRDVDSRTEFPERRLPVTAKGLAYRPGTSGQRRDATGDDAGSELFDRIYWFGGRDGGSRDDAFREAEPLLRVLSADQPAADLHGETGQTPLRWVGAATAVEYPKLRLQRRMVYGVLEDAYRSLREPAGRFAGASSAGDEVSLFDYVGADTDRPLGAWLHLRRDALSNGLVLTQGDADALAAAVQSRAGVHGYDIPRGTDTGGDPYGSNDTGWQRYVARIVTRLKERAGEDERRLGSAITGLRREEEDAFGAWLRDTAYGEWLSASGGGEPRATDEVLGMLDALERDAGELARRFGDDELLPGGTVGEAEDSIRQREEKFEKPDPRNADATMLDKVLSLAAAAAVGVLGAIVARPIAEAVPQFGGGLSQWIPWIAVILAAIGARWITLAWRLHGRVEDATEARARQDAERALIAAYRDRDRVRALRWLQQELRGERGEGATKQEPFFETLRGRIRTARVEVQRLDGIYKGLQDRAAAEVSGGGERPAHVREEVGDCLADDPRMTERIGPEVRRRIAVEPAGAGLRLRLRHADSGDMGHFDPAGADAVDLDKALAAVDQAGLADAARALEHWENGAWGLVNWQLGAHLPADFHAAMLRCSSDDAAAALRSLSSKLRNLELPKAPSVALVSSAAVPEHRRVYAGSAEILARLNDALADPSLTGAQRETLTKYQSNQTRVVPALGEQIVFLDLWADPGDVDWAPHVIGNAVEARRAQETYYSVARTAPDTTADRTTFTVIPELLAATKIEMGSGTVEPLAPAVVARLLGCDLDMQGPTYAELFYLLRHRGLLRARDKGEGPEARTVTVIGDGDDSDAMLLVSRPRGGIGEDRAAFGAGRAAVIDFDTFVEFMRYDGKTLMAGADAVWFSPFPNAEPQVRDWAAAPARVATLQRMAVEEWYGGDVDGDAEAMLAVLEGDLAAMANGDDAVRSSWERAMRRLLAGEERKAIRRTHLSAGAGGGGAAGEPLRPFDATGA